MLLMARSEWKDYKPELNQISPKNLSYPFDKVDILWLMKNKQNNVFKYF